MKNVSRLCVFTLGALLSSACSLQTPIKGNAANDVSWLVGNKCYIEPGKPGHFHYPVNKNQSDNIKVEVQEPDLAISSIKVSANSRQYAYCAHHQDKGEILSATKI